MKKNELLSHLADKTGLKKKDVESLINHQAELIKQQLTSNGELVLPGVGKFAVKARAERAGRNPQTGEPIVIPARQHVGFKAAVDIRSALEEIQS